MALPQFVQIQDTELTAQDLFMMLISTSISFTLLTSFKLHKKCARICQSLSIIVENSQILKRFD
jgi:hypothetical protein